MRGAARLVAPLVAAALALALGLLVLPQGLQLGDEGQWMFGAQRWLDGSSPHDGLDTGDGPLRYGLLALFFSLAGSSALALATLRALLLAAVAGLAVGWLGLVGAGRARWWGLPLALLALPELMLATLLLLWWHALFARRARWALPLAIGALLAHQPWVAGLAALASGLSRGPSRPHPRWALVLLPWALLLLAQLPAGGVGAATGSLASAFGGLGAQLVHALDPATVAARARTLWQGPWLHTPFAGLDTGESPGTAGPGHAALRAAGLWALAAVLLLLPLLWPARVDSVRARATRGLRGLWPWWWIAGSWPATTPALLLAGLTLASPPCGGGGGAGWRRALRPLATALLALAVLVPTGEALWLAAHRHREGLVRWQAPRTGVKLAAGRIDGLQHAVAAMGTPLPGSLLVWPEGLGWNYLLDLPTPSPVAGWHAGMGRHDASIHRALVASPPGAVLLDLAPTFASQHLGAALPRSYGWLRQRYRVRANVAGIDGVRVLAPLPEGTTREQLSLPERLPQVELPIATALSPPLVPGTMVGQRFELPLGDLEGFSVRWSWDGGRELRVPVRVRLWGQFPGQEDLHTLIEAQTLDLVVGEDGERSFVRFGPVEGTRGIPLGIVLEAEARIAGGELRLWWAPYGGASQDPSPGSHALLGLTPVDADLYFSAW